MSEDKREPRRGEKSWKKPAREDWCRVCRGSGIFGTPEFADSHCHRCGGTGTDRPVAQRDTSAKATTLTSAWTWQAELGRVGRHNLSVDAIRAIQDNAFEAGHAAGAADMRERARKMLADAALRYDDRATHECLHDYSVFVAELPPTAPSAGVPVDETGRKERG